MRPAVGQVLSEFWRLSQEAEVAAGSLAEQAVLVEPVEGMEYTPGEQLMVEMLQ
jgi:hypothetical protein